MSDSGSHGGSSQAEVEVPLIFVMNDCRPDDTVNLQIDLPPTLSVLMGIPIPNNNLGSLLPGILAAFRPEERLYALYINARTVAKQYEQNVGAENSNSDYQRALKLYGNWLTGSGTATEPEIARLFQRSTADMSSHLINSLVHFDLYSMIIAVILAWQVSLFFSFFSYVYSTWFFRLCLGARCGATRMRNIKQSPINPSWIFCSVVWCRTFRLRFRAHWNLPFNRQREPFVP